MIILSTTSDVLRAVLLAAHTTNPLQMVASWRDVTTTAYTPGRSLAETNGPTPATLVASPGASTQRVIDHVSVYNADTVAHTLTMQLYDGTNAYPLWRGALGVGERLEFTREAGWRVYSAAGIEIVAALAGANAQRPVPWQFKWLESEYTHTSGTTLSNVTGMEVDVVAGRYYLVRAFANMRTLNGTTGVRMRMNLDGVTFTTTGFGAGHGRTPASASAENISYGTPSSIPTVGAASALAQRYGGNLCYHEMLLVPENTVAAGLKMQVAAEIAENVFVEPGSVICWAEYQP